MSHKTGGNLTKKTNCSQCFMYDVEFFFLRNLFFFNPTILNFILSRKNVIGSATAIFFKLRMHSLPRHS